MSVIFDIGILLAGMGVFIWAVSKCYLYLSVGALVNMVKKFIENLPEEASKFFDRITGVQRVEVPKDFKPPVDEEEL